MISCRFTSPRVGPNHQIFDVDLKFKPKYQTLGLDKWAPLRPLRAASGKCSIVAVASYELARRRGNNQ